MRTRLLYLLALALAPAGLLAVLVAGPALASSPICNTSGGMHCLGAVSLVNNGAVTLTANGRTMIIGPVSGGKNLDFAADSTQCVAVNTGSSHFAEVAAPCTGRTASVWTLVSGNIWQNNWAVRNGFANVDLCSDNLIGDNLFLGTPGGSEFCRWAGGNTPNVPAGPAALPQLGHQAPLYARHAWALAA